MLSVMLLFAAFDLVTVISGFTDFGTLRLHYGESHEIRLPRKGQKLTYQNGVDAPKTLWTSESRATVKDPRHSFNGMYYTLRQLTQKDSGEYVLLDKNQLLLSTTSIIVGANEKNYDLMVGDHLDFQYGFKPMNCNVNFISKYSPGSVDIVYEGRLKDPRFCKEIQLYQPCRISIEGADPSCSGTYEFTDSNGDVALQVELDVTEPPEPEDEDEPGMPTYGWVGIASACCSTLCYCLKCCCCKKSKKKDSSDSEEAADPAEEAELTGVQGGVQYESEPARLISRETEELPYPAAAPQPPTVAPSAPLIHDAPTFDLPSYEEALAMPSTANPQFNFTGMSFSADPQLSSEATGSDVYTSDKLNFL